MPGAPRRRSPCWSGVGGVGPDTPPARRTACTPVARRSPLDWALNCYFRTREVLCHMAEGSVTSERVSVAGAALSAEDYFIFLEHLATYNFARPYTAGKDVLDFGCGTGYGTHSLSQGVNRIVGVDISTDAISAARGEFLTDEGSDRLDYPVIEPIEKGRLPFEDSSFDAVLSFQVIEHVHDVGTYLKEVRRVLRSNGVFVCATPDRRTRLFPGQRPFNRYHLREWNPKDFKEILDGVFSDTKVFGMTGSDRALSGELKRCRTTRLLTYPFTFPGAPEVWRQAGLRGLKSVQQARAGHQDAAASTEPPEVRFGMTLDDVRIAQDAWPSINVITVSS